VEPRIQNVCLLLAGGDIGSIDLDAAAKKVPGDLPKALDDKDAFKRKLALIDPITYAKNARGKRILMLNAARDEVIPRVCTESLHQAFGEPEIVWYSGGHYSVVRHIFGALDRVANFFAAVDGAGVATEIYPLTRSESALLTTGAGPQNVVQITHRWENAANVLQVNRQLGHAGRFTTPAPMTFAAAWDKDNLCCRCTHTGTVNGGALARGKAQIHVAVGSDRNIVTREIRQWSESKAKDAPVSAEISIPWNELGLKPAAGVELQILAVIQSGDGDKAIIHTTGELPKQAVERSIRWWPKFKLAEKP
jgi:hypothetical protein